MRIRRLLTQAAHHRPGGGTAVVVIALLVIVTTAVRWRLDRYLGPQLPFMLYLPAIIVTTAVFGFRAGLATVLVSVALALYLWLSPEWQGAVVDWAAIWSLVSWLTVSIMLVTTIALLQQSTRAESQIAADLREKTERLRESEAKLEAHSRNLEQAVTERTSRLAETIAELESFSYTVSHDLRSPLRSMQGFAEILRSDYGDRLDDTARMLLRGIDEGAKRMDRLVRDVLAYSASGERSMKPLRWTSTPLCGRSWQSIRRSGRRPRSRLCALSIKSSAISPP